MNRLATVLLLFLFVTSVSIAGVAGVAPMPKPTALESPAGMGSALDRALAEKGSVRVEITLDLDSLRDIDKSHPTHGTDVHPRVFDLALASAEGPMLLEQAGDFHLLRIAATRATVAAALEMPEVLAIDLDRREIEPPKPEPAQKMITTCGHIVSSTNACIQSNRFVVSATYAGASSPIAVKGSQSVVFYTFSSSNWEVVAKVLNGCGVNNNYWIFAGAAGTSTLLLTVKDFGKAGAPQVQFLTQNAPIAQVSSMPCS